MTISCEDTERSQGKASFLVLFAERLQAVISFSASFAVVGWIRNVVI